MNSFTRYIAPSPKARYRSRLRNMAATMEQVARAEKPSISMGGTTTCAIPKENVIVSAAYENAVRGLGCCVRCGRECRPQFCHRDEGKGIGIKTDSRECWAGCGPHDGTMGCHHFVGTSGTLSKQERRAEDLRLGALTRAAVLRAGSWPKSVPRWGATPAAIAAQPKE